VAPLLLNHCHTAGSCGEKTFGFDAVPYHSLCHYASGGLFGYSLTFGPDTGQPNTNAAAAIPHNAFMIFQCMFAAIKPALLIGIYAERIKFSAFLASPDLQATFVYDPQGHWVRGTGGRLKDFGAYRKQMKTRRESWR